jgi:hypothetical protein
MKHIIKDIKIKPLQSAIVEDSIIRSFFQERVREISYSIARGNSAFAFTHELNLSSIFSGSETNAKTKKNHNFS